MKLFIFFLASALLLVFATAHAEMVYVPSDAASNDCGCTKYKKPHKKHYTKYKYVKRCKYVKVGHYKKPRIRTSTIYVPGSCETRCDPCTGCRYRSCSSGYTANCRTDFYYHSGRNTARVEICG